MDHSLGELVRIGGERMHDSRRLWERNSRLRGEVIEEIARHPVTNVNEFHAALEKAGKKTVLLSVRNAAGVRFVVVRAEE